MAADLLARGRLAGAQDDRDRPARRRVVDVDRQETAFVVMRVEQRELLMAVNHVHRVVDVERHGCGRHGIARTVGSTRTPISRISSRRLGAFSNATPSVASTDRGRCREADRRPA